MSDRERQEALAALAGAKVMASAWWEVEYAAKAFLEGGVRAPEVLVELRRKIAHVNELHSTLNAPPPRPPLRAPGGAPPARPAPPQRSPPQLQSARGPEQRQKLREQRQLDATRRRGGA